jgi:uncharacterized protein (DUF2062 family)
MTTKTDSAKNSTGKKKKGIIHRILTADSSPHRAALGVAIGLFIAMTPTIGLQMILAGGLAAALRANKALSVSFVWITNALTSVPIFLFNYTVGCWLLRKESRSSVFYQFIGNMLNLKDSGIEKVQAARLLAEGFLLPLWVGSLTVAVVLASLSYFLVRTAVTQYQLTQ